MFQAKDVMCEMVVTVRPESTIDEVISLLLNHRVSGLPVVGDDGRLLGVITEVDIIDLIYDADVESSIVRDYMATDVVCLDAEASLDDAANIFSSHTVRRIPIVRDERLVGVLARRDLIRFVREVRERDEIQPTPFSKEPAATCC